MSRQACKERPQAEAKPTSSSTAGRLRQPSIDAEPTRNPVFDAIGRGLMRLGEKVKPPASIRVGSEVRSKPVVQADSRPPTRSSRGVGPR